MKIWDYINNDFKKYYKEISPQEAVKLFGCNEEDVYYAIDVPGYDGMEHVGFLYAKARYEERLIDQGMDFLEVVRYDGKVFPVQEVGGRISELYPSEVEWVVE